MKEMLFLKPGMFIMPTGMDVFADDTGLEISALNGLPGVHSARFAGENKDSSANIEKVLSMLGNDENRKAQIQNCHCTDS